MKVAWVNAETRDRTGDIQIFGLTLSQLSYRGHGNQALAIPDYDTMRHVARDFDGRQNGYGKI